MTNLKRWDELQDFLPPLASYEYRALEESIKKNGVMQRILALPDGRIIDGWHRYSIDNKAGFDILNIDEESAFSLGIALNLARRQMSPEQINDLQSKLKKEKERQKKVALELRHAGKSQEEVAAILGVSQQTLSDWEQNIPNTEIGNENNPPDLRITIPKSEYPKIYERVEAGETQTSVAADYKVSQPTISKVAKRMKGKKGKRTAAKKQSNFEFLCGDFMSTEIASKLSDSSIDLIFTDPPYGIDYENTWRGLAELSSRALKSGGFLLTYFGQANIWKLVEQLNQHLNYFWLTCIELGGGNRQIFSVKTLNQWKPLLMYYKPPLRLPEQWWLDRIKQRPEKFFHEWQQDVDVARYFIRMFSEPKSLVLDPMCGTGTTAIACWQEGRDCIAIDIDSQNIEITRRRLNETAPPIQ